MAATTLECGPPIASPRRRNLWVIWPGSVSRLAEEAVKLPAGGIKGALLLLGIHAIEQWPAVVIDPVIEKLLDGFPSQRRGFIQVADDFPAQCPQVIDVLLNGFGRQIRSD